VLPTHLLPRGLLLHAVEVTSLRMLLLHLLLLLALVPRTGSLLLLRPGVCCTLWLVLVHWLLPLLQHSACVLINTHSLSSWRLLLAAPRAPVHTCTYGECCCCCWCLYAAWCWRQVAVEPAVRQLHIICAIQAPRCNGCHRLHTEALLLPLLLLLLVLLLWWRLLLLLLRSALFMLLLSRLPLPHRWLCWHRLWSTRCLVLPALPRLPPCLIKQIIQRSQLVITEVCVGSASQGTQAVLC
jgi:hypothetical protein